MSNNSSRTSNELISITEIGAVKSKMIRIQVAARFLIIIIAKCTGIYLGCPKSIFWNVRTFIQLAEKECKIMLVELKSVINTGEADSDLTAENDVWI